MTGKRFYETEYSSVLKNYKELRKKLNDVDKKNRDSFLQMALQIKELKYAVAVRDQEIHSLRQRLCSVNEYNKDGESVEHEGTPRSTSPESNLTEFIHPSPIDEETDETVVEQTAQGRFKESGVLVEVQHINSSDTEISNFSQGLESRVIKVEREDSSRRKRRKDEIGSAPHLFSLERNQN